MTMTANGLAKLIEECGELIQVCGKKLAYFSTDEHPDGQGSLKTRLEEEMGDVMAACGLVTETLGLDEGAICDRAATKLEKFCRWHADPTNNNHGLQPPPPPPACDCGHYEHLAQAEHEPTCAIYGAAKGRTS